MPQVRTKEEVRDLVKDWQKKGDKVVFTNGCFDILHLGHVTYLEAAAKLGDRLVVAVNDDASVRSLEKGAERPINPEQARAAIISSLRAVDAAVIFGESTPLKLIEYFHPDILVKGGDYDPEETNEDSPKYMVGSREVRSWGGSVAIIPTVQGYSTTAIVSKLKP